MTCPKCRLPMRLDSVVQFDADHQIDPGQPRPLLFTCQNAHTVRWRDIEAARPERATERRCAVCGIEVRGSAKTCSSEHRRFVERKRNAAYLAYNRTHRPWRADALNLPPFRFPLELQPWYRGSVTAFKAAIPPRWTRVLPADWWDGWQRVHGAW